jgi:type II secretion system protein C
MIKKLFILAYVLIGVFVLFQASKLIGTILEKSLVINDLDTEVQKVEVREVNKISGFRDELSILSSPLFSIAPAQSQGTAEEAPVVTESPLLKKYELNGTILLERGKSIALIRSAGQRVSEIYRKGDRLDNAEIVKIERDRVLLNDGRNTIVLPMYYRYRSRTTTGQGPEPVREMESADKFSSAREVKKVLSRSEVETKVFQKVNEILTQIAISPYMKDGKMEGLRLVRVPRDNIVYELGGRSGDLVRRVNGHELNQVDQMYKLWENIKDDSFISVDLERNNQIFTYSFDIRE